MPNKEDIFLIWHIGSQLGIVMVTREIGNLRLRSESFNLKMSIVTKLIHSVGHKRQSGNADATHEPKLPCSSAEQSEQGSWQELKYSICDYTSILDLISKF